MPLQLVWFKRDLRTLDHEPLARAMRAGPVVAVYVHEPGYWTLPEHSAIHFDFVRQSLEALEHELSSLHVPLIQYVGEATPALERLHHDVGFDHVWSHEETGLDWTRRRDARVARTLARLGVAWTELAQFGVQRPTSGRDGWAAQWQAFIASPPLPQPEPQAPIDDLVAHVGGHPSPDPELFGLSFDHAPPDDVQPGGAQEAERLLSTFLSERGRDYRALMAKPLEAADACSRLSPHITFGTMSLRTIYHRVQLARELVCASALPPHDLSAWRASYTSMESRLAWHCHFIQKFEDEPELEFANVNRAYDHIRTEHEAEWSGAERERFHAWCTGRTGYPIIDAVMRSLHRKGWATFRMRAMLVSFASYHLWLHWRPTATFLATYFVDFEPGIHYSQFQMQSGVTGINTIRIYSPHKQAVEQDPDGTFIRRYVPELRGVPTVYLFEPHKMPLAAQRKAGCIIGRDYPKPIVEHAQATALAKERIFAVRASREGREEAKRVFVKHGSRKTSRRRRNP